MQTCLLQLLGLSVNLLLDPAHVDVLHQLVNVLGIVCDLYSLMVASLALALAQLWLNYGLRDNLVQIGRHATFVYCGQLVGILLRSFLLGELFRENG